MPTLTRAATTSLPPFTAYKAKTDWPLEHTYATPSLALMVCSAPLYSAFCLSDIKKLDLPCTTGAGGCLSAEHPAKGRTAAIAPSPAKPMPVLLKAMPILRRNMRGSVARSRQTRNAQKLKAL